MPSILDKLEAEWDHEAHAVAALLRRHAESQAPADQPVNIKAAAPAARTEELMSLATDLHNAADRLDKIGEDAVTKLEAVVGSPVGTTALGLVHDVIGLDIDPKIIESALGGLQALLQAYAPAPAAAPPAQDAPVPPLLPGAAA